MRRRSSVQHAFDEARFGHARILNVRDTMPTGAEAVRRAEGWLRGKQVERAGEVLVITGRGNGSPGQVPVVREEIRKLLARLRRAGVVAGVAEHTAGSFAVTLAPLRALFEAPERRRHAGGRAAAGIPPLPQAIAGLELATRARLRDLAIRSLESLGVAAPDERILAAEMEREFSLLVRGAEGRTRGDELWLRDAIEAALREFEEGDR